MTFLMHAEYYDAHRAPDLANIFEQEEEEIEPEENPALHPAFVIQSKKTGLRVELEATPVAVTTKEVFHRVSLKQKTSFATWTKQERHEAACRLHSICGLDTHLLNKIYKLIATH